MSTIEEVALSIVQQLSDAGFTAYYAGGFVRDRLLGVPCSDIDIATDASPSEIASLFAKTIPVGVAFGSVVVVEGGHHFEVTTFRSDATYSDGRHPDEVTFSTPEEDAKRRSFTMNGMFYDPVLEKIIDYVDGRRDIEDKIIRAIGDPQLRFAEDKLRMVRAVRFAVRLGFQIEPATDQAIRDHAHELFPAVAIERVWQEFEKLSQHPRFADFLIGLHRYGLLQEIFPSLKGKEIADRLAPLAHYPAECPTILKLLPLFEESDLAFRLSVCDHLKVSNRDRKLVEEQAALENLLANEQAHPADWAHWYALDNAPLLLQIAADSRVLARREPLRPHIERIRRKTPLVTAAHLRKEGISPGKRMGELLTAAERLAIAEDLDSPEAVINRLKEEHALEEA